MRSSPLLNYFFPFTLSLAIFFTLSFAILAHDSREPLKATPISLYECQRLPTSPYIGSHHFIHRPDALPNLEIDFLALQKLKCYEDEHPQLFSERLNEIDHHIALFDPTKDSRLLSDIEENNSPRINEMIGRRLAPIQSTLKLFYYLRWQSGPLTPPEIQGVFLTSFIHPQTHLSYCPNFYNYKESKLFALLEEYLGFSTEGLYLGKREQLFYDGKTSRSNYLFIREAQLKTIWFYERGSRKILPTQDTEVADKTMRFHWPILEGADPLIKQEGQESYTIIDTRSLHLAPNLTHDKKIGCIPQLRRN